MHLNDDTASPKHQLAFILLNIWNLEFKYVENN